MKPLHRHVVNTSRKVLCTAALAASLTTAAVVTNTPVAGAGEAEPTPDSPQATDRGDARLDLPGQLADPVVPPAAGTGGNPAEGSSAIPATALDAYKRSEVAVAAALPKCKLPWTLVAAIGRVESVHASGYGLKNDGTTEKPIRGPRLDGNGYAKILDTDKGEFDGDTEYDRAFGPLQFIPSTWATWKADGNGDGKRDANNIYDAALGAGLYLCSGGKDLSLPADLDKAILGYNQSREYVNSVLGYMRQYQQDGTAGIPNPPVGNYPTPPTPTIPTPRVPTPQPPATRPNTPNNPTNPTNPSNPGNQTPNPKPTPEPSKPTPEPSKPTPAPATLAKLERVGEAKLEAEAGSLFAEGARFKALLSDGKPAVGQAVVVAVEQDTTGGTGFVFGSESSVVVRTDAQGIATAPRLKAGPKAGTFTLRATAYDAKSQFSVAVDGKTTEKPAEQPVELTGTKTVKVAAGTPVTGLQYLLARGDKPVEGAELTAALVEKSAGGAWTPVDAKTAKGPWFQGATAEEKLFTKALRTGADGKATLPALLTADVPAGTYHLRLLTADKTELIVTIEITAAPAPAPAPKA
ncbi:lytic transglycosylase domain-containing protein [Streptomyces lavendulae]|uniref:lytic transglycosylase domain-containing protein n=1 Tax=Streptomyces lavendulae TaxID=1914 RepID=UPI0024A1D8FC|nr:lytic transglycosylase domain-containing protein [Streptomyces lavendulae]GLX18702.1 lytic transglycosylase [Streptomyces lavendulae subsp. lavendulae]GLX29375.1 lytic transglycosylase [Streptomyces lavendulae subsp. lavendulae]